MSKKAKKDFDPELLRAYLMGATTPAGFTGMDKSSDSIDLHLDDKKVGKGSGKIAPNEALFHQVEEFEKALDKAIASGKFEFRVVHGHGSGKLKEAIHTVLNTHPQVKSYKNDYHSRYGYGSTLIHFK
jgi:hypothetical protein